MPHDMTAGAPAETAPVGAEDRGRERWPDRTSGWPARLLATAGTSAILLLSVGAAARVVLSATSLPPWAVIVLLALLAAAAIAGIRIVGTRIAAAALTRASSDALLQPPATMDGAPDASSGFPLERFQVETREGTRIIPAASVEWVEASGNYARLHLADDSFLCRMSLSQLQNELDSRRFLRVHRSAIVNLDVIDRVETHSSGDAAIWLASGARVRLSRRYAKAFHARTGRGR